MENKVVDWCSGCLEKFPVDDLIQVRQTDEGDEWYTVGVCGGCLSLFYPEGYES